MAVLTPLSQNQDDEKEKMQAQSLSSGAPATIGVTAQPQASPSTPGSGRFVNLQKYLDANKNTNLAGQLSNKLGQEAETTRSNIDQASQSFADQAKQNQAQWASSAGLTQTAVNNPHQILSNPQQLAQFYAARDAAYGGPQSLGDLQGNQNLAALQSGVDKTKRAAELSGTERGRYDLLKETFQKPTYSSGQQKLDQLFLQRQPGQLTALQEATKNQAEQTSQRLEAAKAQTGALASDLGQQATQTQQQIRSQLEQGIKQQQAALQAKAEQTNRQRQSEWAALQNALTRNELSDSQIRALGLGEDYKQLQAMQQRALVFDTPQELVPAGTQGAEFHNPVVEYDRSLRALRGFNLSNFLRPDSYQARAETVATPEEAARMAAYAQLAAGADISGADVLGSYGQDLAGSYSRTAPSVAASFDRAAALNQLRALLGSIQR